MVQQTNRPTGGEILKKVCPDEIANDEKLLEAFTVGFNKAWKYKELERRCVLAQSRVWRGKYEKLLKENNDR